MRWAKKRSGTNTAHLNATLGYRRRGLAGRKIAASEMGLGRKRSRRRGGQVDGIKIHRDLEEVASEAFAVGSGSSFAKVQHSSTTKHYARRSLPVKAFEAIRRLKGLKG